MITAPLALLFFLPFIQKVSCPIVTMPLIDPVSSTPSPFHLAHCGALRSLCRRGFPFPRPRRTRRPHAERLFHIVRRCRKRRMAPKGPSITPRSVLVNSIISDECRRSLDTAPVQKPSAAGRARSDDNCHDLAYFASYNANQALRLPLLGDNTYSWTVLSCQPFFSSPPRHEHMFPPPRVHLLFPFPLQHLGPG